MTELTPLDYNECQGKGTKFRPLFIEALHKALKTHQGETNYVITNDNYPSIKHSAKVFKFTRFC
jgi:hypothetical protein